MSKTNKCKAKLPNGNQCNKTPGPKFVSTGMCGKHQNYPTQHALTIRKSSFTTDDSTPPWYSSKALENDKRRGHSLLPKNIENIPELFETENTSLAEKEIHLRFFGSGNQTWLIAELDPNTGEGFGYCDLGLGHPEWGYVNINELAELNPQPFAIVERDLYFKKKRFKEVMSGADFIEGNSLKEYIDSWAGKTSSSDEIPQAGEPVVILLSPCCNKTMKGVEYGDYRACRECRSTNLEWEKYVAPYKRSEIKKDAEGNEISYIPASPDYSKAQKITDENIDKVYFYG